MQDCHAHHVGVNQTMRLAVWMLFLDRATRLVEFQFLRGTVSPPVFFFVLNGQVHIAERQVPLFSCCTGCSWWATSSQSFASSVGHILECIQPSALVELAMEFAK